jgi:hypothetical protein
MPIPTYDALDAVPEPFREFAREKDGKFTLDLVPGAEVVGLKRKVEELHAARKELADRYKDINVDEYQALKAAGGKAAELDARLKVAAEAEAAAKSKAEQLATRLRRKAVQTEVTRALAAAGANVDLLAPVVERLVDVEEAGDDYHVVVRGADGQLRYKDGAGNRFTVDDLLAELKTKDAYKPAFNVAAPSGGGAAPNAGGTAGGVRVINGSDKAAVMKAIQSGDLAAGKVKIVA